MKIQKSDDMLVLIKMRSLEFVYYQFNSLDIYDLTKTESVSAANKKITITYNPPIIEGMPWR